MQPLKRIDQTFNGADRGCPDNTSRSLPLFIENLETTRSTPPAPIHGGHAEHSTYDMAPYNRRQGADSAFGLS